jgi:hypothetical protein
LWGVRDGDPAWHAGPLVGDGKEIFYVAGRQDDGRADRVWRCVAGRETAGAAVRTHLATGTNVLGNKPQYAVSRDGRFLLNTVIESASAPIVVAVNWMKKLAK